MAAREAIVDSNTTPESNVSQAKKHPSNDYDKFVEKPSSSSLIPFGTYDNLLGAINVY